MISYSKVRYTFKKNEIPSYRCPPGRSNHEDIPSASSKKVYTSKKEVPTYTGDYVIGIATMHKSNLVPVGRDSTMAVDIAKMRRG